jgi:hypothetical protein
MTVYCVFMEILIGSGREMRLQAIFDTRDNANRFVSQWSNPHIKLDIQRWNVLDTME